MRQPFEVKLLEPDCPYRAVSFSLDATRPEEYFEGLESRLSRLRVRGPVVLDLLACNGATKRRFAVVAFDGSKLRLETMRLESAESLDGRLVGLCKSFYAKNSKRLASSVLSATARRALATP